MRIQIMFLGLLVLLVSCQAPEKKILNPYEAPAKKTKESLGLVPRGLDLGRAPEKIVFACCSDSSQEQPIWAAINDEHPDLMISLGDHIKGPSAGAKSLAEQYKDLVKMSEYKRARETIPFLATWDDLDYGLPNSGAENPMKEDARRAFWFHFPYIKDSTLLDQPGIFHSKVLGGVREGRGRRARTTPSVHVIMLDTRWNRTAPTDAKATLLGSDQWEWLADQLREPADFKILASSIQILAESHAFEKWAQYPAEKQKLLGMIASIKPKNLILVSGDRKLAAISKMDLKGYGPLYEITAGSLNLPQELQEKDPVYLQDAFPKENFGLIQLNWNRRTAAVEIRNVDGKPVQTLEIKLK